MRSYHFRVALSLGLVLSACQTSDKTHPSSSEPLAYDGILDEMDSLPDCNEETVGSLFWVRTQKAGFECTADKQWGKRGTVEPDDTDFGPRSSLDYNFDIKRL